MNMFRVLLKKQFMEMNRMYFYNAKTGQIRSTGSIVGIIILFLFVFLSMGGMFFSTGISMTLMLFDSETGSSTLTPEAGLWIVLLLMALFSVMFGTFGSVFSTYASVYMAKDNEFLLSLPIRPSAILVSRLSGVVFMSFLYTAVAWLPALAGVLVSGVFALSAQLIILGILTLLTLTMFVTFLSCILGWVISLIAKKLKRKSFLIVIVALGFFVLYYMFAFRMHSIMTSLAANAEAIGETVSGRLVPLYWLGTGAGGNIGGFLLALLIVAALCALTFFVMTVSFLPTVTAVGGEKSKAYKAESVRSSKLSVALLGKEFKRFTSSANLMLNTGFGAFMMPILIILLIVNRERVSNLPAAVGLSGDSLLPVIVTAGLLFCMFLDVLCASSVSLESKNIWILRSLPCPSAEVLKAKFRTQFLLNIVPAAVCCVVAMTVLGIGPLTQILAVLLLASAEWLSAGFCLSMNLCFPYLNWTNEAYAVKQGTSVLICTFAGMGMGLLLAGILAVFGIFLDVRIGMAVGTVLCSVPAALIQLWVGRRGVRRWEEI